MTDISAPKSKRYSLRLPDPWSVGALLIAAFVLAPIVSVLWIALNPTENIWPHLIATTLPRYFGTTLVMMFSVGAVAAATGTGAAWLVVRYSFPGVRVLEWLLLLPLAIPAYIGAYALVDFLEYAGPVQTALRGMFGWQTSRDYWFPEIRSQWAAVVVMSASMYPYVYLLARAGFREQSGCGHEVAQSLGAGGLSRFLRIGLPLARPAIAAGTAIVMMETVNDFGTMDYFAVQTLTTGIFTTWLESNNAGGAAQIACVVLSLVIFLVALEKASRKKVRFYALSRRHRPIQRLPLHGVPGWLATAACTVPFMVGFILPAAVIGDHAIENIDGFWASGLLKAFWNTLTVGGIAAVLTVLAALFMVYGVRLSGRKLPAMIAPVTTIGYAAPGAVLGVGILIPLAQVDHLLADLVEAFTGGRAGLILTGSAFALVVAYSVRFFAIAQGATDAAMGRVAPSLPMAARSLGRTKFRVLAEVYMPLMRGSIGSALLLVFVDCVKELPATLLLRPFNYSTLATRVYDEASLENLGDAAPAAVLVSLVGLIAVGMLARANR
ncbi:iron ABC transporter permease [Donghicola sp. C2-DW-16]|uniref:Iron ABC transporter permease n=1 Tax=Donghicola mangrovi TaxID=2729614 RepID=A0ABX2PGL1_9RHOB|nr:iron ABC transporter permease [Donghicola mangrovi]NVO28548.1 iron ABC transporter permease [Donghicola mangrovi]